MGSVHSCSHCGIFFLHLHFHFLLGKFEGEKAGLEQVQLVKLLRELWFCQVRSSFSLYDDDDDAPPKGRLEGWKVGRLECWKARRLEGW